MAGRGVHVGRERCVMVVLCSDARGTRNDVRDLFARLRVNTQQRRDAEGGRGRAQQGTCSCATTRFVAKLPSWWRSPTSWASPRGGARHQSIRGGASSGTCGWPLHDMARTLRELLPSPLVTRRGRNNEGKYVFSYVKLGLSGSPSRRQRKFTMTII